MDANTLIISTLSRSSTAIRVGNTGEYTIQLFMKIRGGERESGRERKSEGGEER